MMRAHKRAYHEFNKQEIHSIQTKLTEWYNTNRRKLPWRGDKPPYGNDSLSINENINNLNIEPPTKKRKLSNTDNNNSRNKRQKQTQLSSFFKIKSTKNSDSKSNLKKTKINHVNDKYNDIDESILNVTAYHIWISEIMLQQTKVETVISYYLKWMKEFPSIDKLSSATLEQVNDIWAGLGYYRRAKFLHQGAKEIIDNFNGILPQTIKELKSIKGIGDYTAGAISSIAYNKCNPAVDGNLVRVISRLRAIACLASPPLKIHWDLASKLVENTENPGILNQAFMELGATICIPKSPKCHLCPVSTHCRAYHEVKQKKRPIVTDDISQDEECKICVALPIQDIEDLKVAMYPMKKIKSKVREQIIVSGIIMIGSNVLMIKRPKDGLLANQWEFPMKILFETVPKDMTKKTKTKTKTKTKQFDQVTMYQKLIERVNKLYGENVVIEKYKYVGSSLHIFSHIRQTAHMFRIYLDPKKIEIDDELIYDQEYKWYSFKEMDNKQLTMCIKKQWKVHTNFDKTLKNTFQPKKSGRKRKRQAIE